MNRMKTLPYYQSIKEIYFDKNLLLNPESEKRLRHKKTLAMILSESNALFNDQSLDKIVINALDPINSAGDYIDEISIETNYVRGYPFLFLTFSALKDNQPSLMKVHVQLNSKIEVC